MITNLFENRIGLFYLILILTLVSVFLTGSILKCYISRCYPFFNPLKILKHEFVRIYLLIRYNPEYDLFYILYVLNTCNKQKNNSIDYYINTFNIRKFITYAGVEPYDQAICRIKDIQNLFPKLFNYILQKEEFNSHDFSFLKMLLNSNIKQYFDQSIDKKKLDLILMEGKQLTDSQEDKRTKATYFVLLNRKKLLQFDYANEASFYSFCENLIGYDKKGGLFVKQLLTYPFIVTKLHTAKNVYARNIKIHSIFKKIGLSIICNYIEDELQNNVFKNYYSKSDFR